MENMIRRRILLAGIGASVLVPLKAGATSDHEWIETNPHMTIAELVEEARRRSGTDAKAIEFNIMVEMTDKA